MISSANLVSIMNHIDKQNNHQLMGDNLFSGGTFSGRYGNHLRYLLKLLRAKQVLREKYEDGYSGYVDVDVLLEDGTIFSYCYYYGSCSGCDEWESLNYNDRQIMKEMLTHGSFLNNLKEYRGWRKTVEEQNKGVDNEEQ